MLKKCLCVILLVSAHFLCIAGELDSSSLKSVKLYKDSQPSLSTKIFENLLDVPPPTTAPKSVNPLRETEKIQNATQYINTVNKPTEVKTKELNLKSRNDQSMVDSALNYGVNEAMPLLNLQTKEMLKKVSPTLNANISVSNVDSSGNFSGSGYIKDQLFTSKHYEVYGEIQANKKTNQNQWNQVYTVGQKIKAENKMYLLGSISQHQGDSNVFNQGFETNPQVWTYGVGYEPSDNFSVFLKQSQSTGGRENTQGGMNYTYRFGGK